MNIEYMTFGKNKKQQNVSLIFVLLSIKFVIVCMKKRNQIQQRFCFPMNKVRTFLLIDTYDIIGNIN